MCPSRPARGADRPARSVTMTAARSKPNDRPRLSLEALWGLLRETVSEWSQDKVPRLGAALAYYTVFSLAPLLIIAVVISGAVFGQQTAQDRIVAEVAIVIGPEGAEAISRMIDSAKLPRDAGIATSAIGGVTLLIGALGAFSQLQDAFDTIWEVVPKPEAGWRRLLQTRLISFAMALAAGFLLLVSLIINAVLTAIPGYLGSRLSNFALVAALFNVLLPLAVTTVLFAVMFKVLPDVRLAWRDVWLGGLITALLFTLGKSVIGFYLGNSQVGTTYGAAGSVVIILVWVYYTAQILYFGAEFTRVYVRRYGKKPAQLTENAAPVTQPEQLQQGWPRTPDAVSQMSQQRRPSQPRPGLSQKRRPRDYTGPLLGFIAGVGAGVVVAARALRTGSS